MPYQYLTNPNLCEQVYAIRKLATFDLGTQHWVDPSQISYGVPSDLGGGEDDSEDNIQIIKADDDDDDDEEKASADNNENPDDNGDGGFDEED